MIPSPLTEVRMSVDNEFAAEARQASIYKDAFIRDFGVREVKWSPRSVAAVVRDAWLPTTAFREFWKLLLASGLRDFRYPARDGVWDHGEVWHVKRGGFPWAIVGHPYDIQDNELEALRGLAAFPKFLVSVDDRPSHHGFGTHHVRLQLASAGLPGGTIVTTRDLRVPLGV